MDRYPWEGPDNNEIDEEELEVERVIEEAIKDEEEREDNELLQYNPWDDEATFNESEFERELLGYPEHMRIYLRAELARIRNLKDVPLPCEEFGHFVPKGLGKSMKLTIDMTRAKHVEETNPPVESIDPLQVTWAQLYWYSNRHTPGTLILFNNGEFRAYTQEFSYFVNQVLSLTPHFLTLKNITLKTPWVTM